MKTRLQDAKIRAAKAPANGRLELKDSKVDGLMLRVTSGGAKSFCIVFKVPGQHPDGPSKTGAPRKGKPHRMTLGSYPFMSLVEAREAAEKILEQVDRGIDPRPKRMETIRAEATNTVAAVARRFIIQECGGMASAGRVERTLELHVLPRLGNRPIEDIKRSDIHDLIDALIDKGREGGPLPGAAREVIKHVHRLFDFAYDRGIIKSNPAHKFKRKDIKATGKAHRPLTDAELKAIWAAANRIGYPHGPWIQLLMLTGRRRDEWAKARRAQIDVATRTHSILPEDYKTDIPHSVPLAPAAWAIVEGLPVWNEGDYLFSSNGGTVAINSAGAAKKKIAKLTGTMADWQFHDLRVSCETRMAALGIPPDHFEACLGHVKKGMQKVYNQHSYADEKKAAFDLYAKHLMEVVA